MAFDTHNNLGYSLIQTVISQNSTTIIFDVLAGHGARFSTGQQITIWPASQAAALLDNSMICRVTGITSDQITADITSGSREGTIVRTIQQEDQVANTVTKKALTDIESAINTNITNIATNTSAISTIVGELPAGAVVGTIDTQTLTHKDLTDASNSFPTSLSPQDGWIATSDTFVYVSANSFKITGLNKTAIYTKGTRIKFTNNSTTYYGVVISSSFSTDTTVTLAPNDDYSIANSAITSPSYSYQVNPQGYPTWFNFTPTIILATGATGALSKSFCKFRIIGAEITVVGNYGAGTLGGTITGVTYNFTLPVTCDNLGYADYAGWGQMRQATRYQASIFSNGGTSIDVGRYDQATLSSTTLEISFGIIYGF